MKKIRDIISITACATWIVMAATTAAPIYAQNNNAGVKDAQSLGGGINDTGTNVVAGDKSLVTGKSAFDIVNGIVLWILGLAGILALVALVIGGMMHILSLGNENRVSTAKQIILYAIIGLIVIGASFLIIKTIGTIFTK